MIKKPMTLVIETWDLNPDDIRALCDQGDVRYMCWGHASQEKEELKAKNDLLLEVIEDLLEACDVALKSADKSAVSLIQKAIARANGV